MNKLILTLLLFCCCKVSANLMITPTRVAFEERQRIERVTIINNGDVTKSYRLEFQEKLALKEGGYANFAEQKINPMAASHFIRISPRQVTLGPGERQVIKLAVRRKANMEQGEYRSHLLFRELPNNKGKLQEGINIDVLMSYSIPVMLRVGDANPQVQLEDVIVSNAKNGRQAITVLLNRTGKYSSFGELSAYWQGKNDVKPVRIGVLNKFAVYPELNQRSVEFSIDPAIKLGPSGKVLIKYVGDEEYTDRTFVDDSVSL
ncbi:MULTISPECIES: fimbrial biogenesis chaperone [Pseudoalteromonas]|nr:MULTISPECIES: fimbria/pilus periplasmic chaperone [Pseudoalteromonas]MDP4488612.1 fimbria/pilus periplasmic chaperone [Pseudoalteromonas piscicida]